MNGFEKTRELVEAIARTGRAERGVSRLALTESDREARAIAVSEMESLGMTVRTDACCNIWAEYPGTSDQPGVVIGSHLDSVPEGGDYDGVLGVCAGCQLLAIAAGGKLIQHLPNAEEAHRGGKSHSATLLAAGALGAALDLRPGEEFTVNSFHHQAVAPGIEAYGFAVTARAFDGTIEAIERCGADGAPGDRMVLGVQFHPERMDDFGPRLFSALVEAARKV